MLVMLGILQNKTACFFTRYILIRRSWPSNHYLFCIFLMQHLFVVLRLNGYDPIKKPLKNHPIYREIHISMV